MTERCEFFYFVYLFSKIFNFNYMSWKNDIENKRFSIKTGDGKEYFPLFKPQERSIEFNTSIFDFIDVEDSLVERKKARSPKYPFTFWFQGEDCVQQANDFLESAKDNRYWTVNHPYYGIIKGQPLSITQNDVNFNITEITVDFWKTIVFDYPKSQLSVKDNVLVRKEEVNVNCINSYSNNSVLASEDIQKNKQSNAIVNDSFDSIQTDETNADYQNAFSQAQKANDNLLSNPNEAISKAIELLNIPSTYDAKVIDKIKAYVDAYYRLKKELITVADKLFFESFIGSLIANLCNASVNYNFETDYQVATEVESVVSDILTIYEDWFTILDNASTSNYEVNNPFQPDASVQTSIQNLVLFTVANLYDLAFDAQQERIVYTEKDTNLILLVHKYFGGVTDESLERFRQINDIKMKSLFKIKKGTKIKYYV